MENTDNTHSHVLVRREWHLEGDVCVLEVDMVQGVERALFNGLGGRGRVLGGGQHPAVPGQAAQTSRISNGPSRVPGDAFATLRTHQRLTLALTLQSTALPPSEPGPILRDLHSLFQGYVLAFSSVHMHPAYCRVGEGIACIGPASVGEQCTLWRSHLRVRPLCRALLVQYKLCPPAPCLSHTLGPTRLQQPCLQLTMGARSLSGTHVSPS